MIISIEIRVPRSQNSKIKKANQLFHQAKDQKSLFLKVQSSKLQEVCIFMQE